MPRFKRKWIPAQKDMLAFYKCQWKQRRKKTLGRILFILGLGLLINLYPLFSEGQISTTAVFFLFFTLLVLLVYLLVYPNLYFLRARKAYLWDAYCREEQELTVEGENLHIQSKHRSMILQPTSLIGVQECSDYFFFFYAPGSAILLPKNIIQKGPEGDKLQSWLETFAQKVNNKSDQEDPRFLPL